MGLAWKGMVHVLNVVGECKADEDWQQEESGR